MISNEFYLKFKENTKNEKIYFIRRFHIAFRFDCFGWGVQFRLAGAFETFGTANYRQSITGGAVLQTRVGPIFLGGSVNERGRGRFYFSLGRFF